MKRILFNATHAEELRVAIVDGQKLLDLDLESAIRAQVKGNIYKATVTRVEPSLEACFVNYGSERHGFLPFKEIYRGYFQNYSSNTPLSRVNIKDVIKEGQQLIIQVEKDERGNKGAALTTFISLAGRFLVLMPNNPKGGGISRRVEGEERSNIKRALDSLDVPKQHAMIARTAAMGRSDEELAWDYEFLIQLWTAIEDAAANTKAPALIYQESNLLVRAIRDHLNNNVQELIIDDQEIFERASRFVSQVMPRNLPKLKLHAETTPLFSHFQIENQIESAFSREVRLPSGGAIVIDHTEALISIDVNSARATKGSDIEETALNTNLEAVEEIARQLRFRDLGGLLVLDLIDMSLNKNQRRVEARLKASLKQDRARVQIGRISRFGLLEMSRQRIRASIGDSNYHTCPRCEGTGHIRSIVSGSLSLLRIIEEEALKENTESIQVFLPVSTAAYILNEKRRELAQMEARLATRVVVVPVRAMESPHYEIKRLRSNELDESPSKASYELSLEVDSLDEFKDITGRKPRPEKPVIGFDQMTPSSPPPTAAATPTLGATAAKGVQTQETDQGLIKRLWKTIKGEAVGPSKPAEPNQTEAAPAKPAENPAPNKQEATENQRANPSRPRGRPQNRNKPNTRRPRPSGNRRRPNNKPDQAHPQTKKKVQKKAQAKKQTHNRGNSQPNHQNHTKENVQENPRRNAQGNTRGNTQQKPQGNVRGNTQKQANGNVRKNTPEKSQGNLRKSTREESPGNVRENSANKTQTAQRENRRVNKPATDKQAPNTEVKRSRTPVKKEDTSKPPKQKSEQTKGKTEQKAKPVKDNSAKAKTETPVQSPPRGRGRPRKNANPDSAPPKAVTTTKKKVAKKKRVAKKSVADDGNK